MSGCARNEAFTRLLDYDADHLNFNTELEWWLQWGRRMGDYVNASLVDALQKIAKAESGDGAWIAKHAHEHNGFTEPKGDKHVRQTRSPNNS